jgi:hypothetical protein
MEHRRARRRARPAGHATAAVPGGVGHRRRPGRPWDDLLDYVVEHLGHPGAVLVIDETGDLKKGTATPQCARMASPGLMLNGALAEDLGAPEPGSDSLRNEDHEGLPVGGPCVCRVESTVAVTPHPHRGRLDRVRYRGLQRALQCGARSPDSRRGPRTCNCWDYENV